MKTKTFSFDLPEELIAQHPAEERGTSRLLRVQRSSQKISHHTVKDLPDIIPDNAVLVMNNSRVRKARIYATTEHGGQVEFLLLEQRSPRRWKAMVSKAKKQKPGRSYTLPGDVQAEIVNSEHEFRIVEFTPEIDDDYLDIHGHMPLPPYIRRKDTPEDAGRYQTVYASETGSVAAPTAGLHLTDEILAELAARGVELAHVTLHVGIGTFLPIRTEDVEAHRMHTEHYAVPAETAEMVNRAKSEGRPVCAVGTTSVRTLESAWQAGDKDKPGDSRQTGRLQAGEGSTDLYIYPGYEFKAVDQMFTNFHTPESSLLVMVSAFAGKQLIEKAYRTAIQEKYRFFSYGDAMLIQ
ncbi:MAG: tRNA preQ1(34) S-adenosylmethionine ribosyltransferase-isomerase QueA [Spirochaetota bacterium]